MTRPADIDIDTRMKEPGTSFLPQHSSFFSVVALGATPVRFGEAIQ